MGIKGNHLKCGHQLKVCPYCTHIGCNYAGCDNSIGGSHTSEVCEMCGMDGTEYMENFQYAKQQRAQEARYEKESNQRRMKELEQQQRYNSYSGGPTQSMRLFFNFKFIILMGACSVLSQFIKHDQFEGIPKIIIGCINILGALGVFLYIILVKLFYGILNYI